MMENLVCLTVEERLYGLSLIWQEANYNFAFFDRVPDLDWEASYKEYIPQVIAADDIFTYYDLLARFTASSERRSYAGRSPKVRVPEPGSAKTNVDECRQDPNCDQCLPYHRVQSPDRFRTP